MAWRDWFRKGGIEHQNPLPGRTKVVDQHKRHAEDRAASPVGAMKLPVSPVAPTPVTPDSLTREEVVAPVAAGMKNSPDFSPGTRVGESFVVRFRLGEGGMSTVYLAHHEEWDLEVALKVPKPEILADRENFHRITREAEFWTDLGLHPHIAYFYYVHPLGDLPVLVVEYLDGGNLRDWIAEGKCAELSIGLDLAIQFCHALEHAHSKGLVHRDIKPENVLLAQDGTLKLTDFGIARAVGESTPIPLVQVRSPHSGTVGAIGTYEYMAPEQFESARDVDARADIFAFGVCVYEMFCGRRPYDIAAGERREPPDPNILRGDNALPQRLCELIKHCVDWDRERRPPSAAKIRSELCELYHAVFRRQSDWAEIPEVEIEADGWNNRGVSYTQLRRYEEARLSFEEALKANSHHLQANYNSGLIEWRAAEIDDATLLRRMNQLRSIALDKREFAGLRAAIHLERLDSDAARCELAPFPGLFEARFSAHRDKRAESFQELPHRALSFAMTPDGRYALTGHKACMRVWDLGQRERIRSLAWNLKDISSVAVDQHGRVGIVVSGDGSLSVWDLQTSDCIRMIKDPNRLMAPVLAGTIDGNWAFCLSRSGTLLLWDLQKALCCWEIEGHSSPIVGVALSGDGTRAVSASVDGIIKIWDLTRHACLREIRDDTGSVEAIAATEDLRTIATLSKEGTPRVYDVETGQHRSFAFKGANFTAVALSGERNTAVATTREGHAIFCELGSGRCFRTIDRIGPPIVQLGLGGGMTALLRSQAGALLVLDFDIRHKQPAPFYPCRPRSFRELQSRQTARRAIIPRLSAMRDQGRHADAFGELLAFWRDDEFTPSPEVWEFYTNLRHRGRDKEPLVALSSTSFQIAAQRIAVAAGAARIVAVSETGEVSIWPTADPTSPQPFRVSPAVSAVAVTDDGRSALLGDTDGVLTLWSAEHKLAVSKERGHSGRILSVAASDDGRWALSGGIDRKLILWDLRQMKPEFEMTGSLGWVQSVALATQARRAVSGGGDHAVRVWDLNTGQCTGTLRGHGLWINSTAISSDGRYALSGSEDKTVRYWDLDTGRCLQVLEGHSREVLSVALTADGRHAFSGSSDCGIRVWKVETGECILSMDASSAICSLALSPSTSSLFSGHVDGTVVEWRLVWNVEFPGASGLVG
jgi:WD40 repeat protein/serine/threonine protein kinase